jgi:hypothetical protein
MLTTIVCLFLTTACGQKRQPTPPPMEPDLAASLGLGEDALDPSQRDKMAGYNRWKSKPEPDGTASPLSPTRRRIARPSGLE